MALTAAQRARLIEARDAIDAVLTEEVAATAPPIPNAPTGRREIAWGAKVSPVFRERVWWICDQLGIDPDYLMSCMAFESGRTFSPSVRNMAGSGATGLIQFMPSTARALGTSTDALAAMTAESQLNFVYKYFRPYYGRLKTLADVYMAILWPKGVGQPESYAIFTQGGVTYRQNAGLDTNKDGRVTKLEASTKVTALYSEGRRAENMA